MGLQTPKNLTTTGKKNHKMLDIRRRDIIQNDCDNYLENYLHNYSDRYPHSAPPPTPAASRPGSWAGCSPSTSATAGPAAWRPGRTCRTTSVIGRRIDGRREVREQKPCQTQFPVSNSPVKKQQFREQHVLVEIT